MCRASPGRKALTMPAASLRLVAHMDSKLAYWGACHDAASIAREAAVGAAPGASAPDGAAPSSSTPPAQLAALGAEGPMGAAAALASVASSRPGERLLLACRGFAEGSGWVLASQEGGRQLLVSMGSLPAAESTLPGAVAAAHKLGLQVVPGLAGLP